VADAFVALGVPVVDTDAIAHELSAAGGAGQKAVAAAFGPAAVADDGSLDRGWLRSQAFTDPAFRVCL
jgi:dephospho-CoA kinase